MEEEECPVNLLDQGSCTERHWQQLVLSLVNLWNLLKQRKLVGRQRRKKDTVQDHLLPVES